MGGTNFFIPRRELILKAEIIDASEQLRLDKNVEVLLPGDCIAWNTIINSTTDDSRLKDLCPLHAKIASDQQHMTRIACIDREQLLAKYENVLKDYIFILNSPGQLLDAAHTAPLRSALDEIEGAITEHCATHGCDPAWVQARRA